MDIFTAMSFHPFEQEVHKEGYAAVAGVDEAGRGPLAGPVVAAAVILNNDIPGGVNDSKALSANQRETIFQALNQGDAVIGTGVVDQFEIDRINILQATVRAMQQAVSALKSSPDYLLVDGKYLPKFDYPARAIIHGDSRCKSIAAASVVAKVTRDQMLVDLDKFFPGYGFAQHKGYGTKQHREAIERFGPTPLHRLSFGGVKEHTRDFLKQRKALGKWGEDYTCYRLWERGVQVLSRNYHAGAEAEIDIVALHENTLRFIEVKTGTAKDFSGPEEWVDRRKERKIFEAAEHFLFRNDKYQDLPSQFDLAAVEMKNGKTKVTYYEHAFTG